MRQPRHDRYATLQNVKALISWMCARTAYLIEKLEITEAVEFEAWLEDLQKQCQRVPREKLRDKVHAELPLFIGSEDHWPQVKSAFRKSMYDADNLKITVEKEVLSKLSNLKNSLGEDTYNSTLYLLLENASATSNHHMTMKTWRVLSSAICEAKFGRIMASTLSGEPLPKSIQERLPWHFQSTMAAPIHTLLGALQNIVSDTAKLSKFVSNADVPAASIEDLLRHIKLKSVSEGYNVVCGYSRVARISLEVNQLTGFISIGVRLDYFISDLIKAGE